MLIHAFDRPSWARALALAAGTDLHAALAARLVRLEAEGLVGMTDLLVVAADTADAELVDPDGRRSDDPAFLTVIDFAFRQGSHLVGVTIVGNAGAGVEFVTAEEGGHPALAALLLEQLA